MDDIVWQRVDQGRLEEPLSSRLKLVSNRKHMKEEQCEKRTFSAQDLRNTVLLLQETLLVHLVQQTPLAVPAQDRIQKLLTVLLRAKIAHLNHDQRVLVCRSGRQENISIQLPRHAFDAVAEVLDQRGRRRAVEAAVAGSKITM